MNLVLLGPSGVGKGTHAAALIARHGLRHVSTGDLLRQNLAARNALGLLARKYMEAGELVPDEVVDAMIEEWVGAVGAGQGMLFDGFPRTAYQAAFLEGLLAPLGRKLDAAIYLRLADDEIVARLSGRRICRQCQAPYHVDAKPPARPGVCDACGGPLYQRPDDTPELVRARLRVFHRHAGPVIEHYAAAGRLIILPATGSIGDVAARLASALAEVERGAGRFADRAAAAALAAPPVAPVPARLARPSLDLVLLGGPGSGKGTQAEQLSAQLRLPHIATGDLFRENLRQATPLGQLAKTYMDRGELVPDDVTEAMVEERLARSDTQPGFILDGFPRTLPQAEALAEMLAKLQRRLAGVLCINVSDEAIVGRLSGRLICRQCQAPYHRQFKPPRRPGVCDLCGGELYQRDDDNPATVRARLKTYHDQTEPLIGWYRQAGLLHAIDGEGEVAAVTARTLAVARELAAARGLGPGHPSP